MENNKFFKNNSSDQRRPGGNTVDQCHIKYLYDAPPDIL